MGEGGGERGQYKATLLQVGRRRGRCKGIVRSAQRHGAAGLLLMQLQLQV